MKQYFPSYSPRNRDLSIFFHYVRMRSTTEVRLTPPPIADFHFKTVLFNWIAVVVTCATIIFDRFPRFGYLFHDQRSFPRPSFHWKFGFRNGLNQLGFNCVQLFCNRSQPAVLSKTFFGDRTSLLTLSEGAKILH